MNNKQQTSSGQDGKFFSGFLFGLLVGAAIVFLLGTQKGKRLLKTISEEGADNISEILNRVDKDKNLNEMVAEEAEDEDTSVREFKEEGRILEERAKPRVRRFFRGVSKRVN